MAHDQDPRTAIRGTAADSSGQTIIRTRHWHSSFFKLPRKIRSVIYGYVIGKCWVSTTYKEGLFPAQFGWINRQMRTEMLPLYYARLEVKLGLGSQKLWDRTLQWLTVVGEAARYLRIFNIFVDDSFSALGEVNITLTDEVRKPDEEGGAKVDFLFPYRFGDASVLEAHAWQLYHDMEHLKQIGFLDGKRLIELLSAFNSTCQTLARQAREPPSLTSLSS